ncbi:MAG: oligosaccharide flippase family protein [Candidatus Paceibacterota bacterium]
MKVVKKRIARLLRWSEKYTKTDMIYIARGGFWMVLTRVFLLIISFATLAAFGNLLPSETYGTYQFIISTVGILSITALPGLGSAMIRSIAKKKEASFDLAFKTKLKWATLGSLALLLISGWYYINGNDLLAVAFLIVAPIFPLKMASGIFAGFWNGRKKFDKRMILKVSTDAGIAISVIIALFATDNLWIIIATFFFSTALFNFLAYLYTFKQVENEEIDEEMIPYGKNLTVMGFIGNIASHLDKIVIWKFLGPVEVAVYTFSYTPIKKLKGFLPINALLLPKLSESGVKGEKRKKKIFKKFLLMFAITIPFAALLAGAAPFVYKIVFPQYLDSVIYFQVLTTLVALLPFTVLATSLVAEMQTKYLYISRTVVPTAKIVLFLVLTPIYDIWGVIFAVVFTVFMGGMINLYFFWRM